MLRPRPNSKHTTQIKTKTNQESHEHWQNKTKQSDVKRKRFDSKHWTLQGTESSSAVRSLQNRSNNKTEYKQNKEKPWKTDKQAVMWSCRIKI